MSRLESAAKPLILDLMRQKISIMTLTDEARTVLSRWAAKTAFIVSVVQTIRFELPWQIFQTKYILGLYAYLTFFAIKCFRQSALVNRLGCGTPKTFTFSGDVSPISKKA